MGDQTCGFVCGTVSHVLRCLYTHKKLILFFLNVHGPMNTSGLLQSK